MMREIVRHCLCNSFVWRKLLLASIITTATAIFISSFVFPYPLKLWLESPPEVVLSHASVNSSLQLIEIVSETKIEQLHTPKAPILAVNLTLPYKESNATVLIKKESVAKKRKKKIKVYNDAKNVTPVPDRIVPSRQLQKYIWSLSPNDALLYARKEIEHAPIIKDDPYLYAPIFRNLSVFKRSYELMELILKVYIYPDGKKPIFHQPRLQGIYASEGWFMKFIHESREFVTRDPEKAHLYYLPYSAHQLEMALYKPNLHDLRPLSIVLRDYVNMISAKYPFWNRTHGKDHFLVACHDWGPYTLTMHNELAKNTIKALCNADVSEGIFNASNDISLPETTIRTPRRPLRNVGGGIRVSQRPILAFFAGNMHGRVRPNLLKYWKNKDEDMRIYGVLPSRISRNMSYVHHMKSSRFCICPMGYEVNSPRIVESIYYECVPVIIADNFVLPFSDVLDWSAFSIVVAEKDIPKLKEILLAIPLRRYLTMLTNLKMLQKHFLWNPTPLRYDLFHMILHSIWLSKLNQIQISDS
ncbi:Exostosin family protein [Euphorbia peplus]|nr:Exostosin family protein [Euphorbia peplus]